MYVGDRVFRPCRTDFFWERYRVEFPDGYRFCLFPADMYLSALEIEKFAAPVGDTDNEIQEALIVLHQVRLYELRESLVFIVRIGQERGIGNYEGFFFFFLDFLFRLFSLRVVLRLKFIF